MLSEVVGVIKDTSQQHWENQERRPVSQLSPEGRFIMAIFVYLVVALVVVAFVAMSLIGLQSDKNL